MNEKAPHHNGHPVEVEEELRFTGRRTRQTDDDDEEDMDALIEELESLDPDAEIEEEIQELGSARQVPEEMLQTDTRVGLTEPEVIARRKKYGLNQMKEEKENLVLKFLGYFVGPIQFVMEVTEPKHLCVNIVLTMNRQLQHWPLASATGLISASFVLCCFSMLQSGSFKNFKQGQSSRS